MNVMRFNSASRWRNFEAFLALERGVLVTARPTFAHRSSVEFVVLRVPLIGALLIDQLEDRHFWLMRKPFFQAPILVGEASGLFALMLRVARKQSSGDLALHFRG